MSSTKSLQQSGSRDLWIDNIKGILIILVVVGHFIAGMINEYPTIMALSNFINLFHMPAFLFISGYLCKRRIKTRDTRAVINTNVVPFIMAQIVMYLAASLVKDGYKAVSIEKSMSLSNFTFFTPIYQLWFFYALIIGYILCVLLKPEKRPVLSMLFAVCLCIVVGFCPEIKVFRIIKCLGFFPFYLMGYLIPEKAMNFINKKRALSVIGGLVVIAVALFMWYTRHNEGLTFTFGFATPYSKYPEKYSLASAILIRVIVLITASAMSFALFSLCPRKKTVFTKLGKRSLFVFVLHAVVLIVVRSYNYEYKFLFDLDTPLLKLVYLLLVVLLAFVLASDPVYKLFKKILQPDFDVAKLAEYFTKKEKPEEDKTES